MRILGIIMLSAMSMAFSGTAFGKSFSDNGDHTVTDRESALVWQKPEGGLMTWESSISYCEDLDLGGNTGWRLPSKRELISLVDYTSFSPALATEYFPHVNSSFYWSSTTDVGRTGSAWGVFFENGTVETIGKVDRYQVRCVRGGV